MNKSKLWLVLLALLFITPCFAKRKVVLVGKWQRIQPTVFEEYPIEAWVEDENRELLMEFSGNLGTVQGNKGQIVYSETVDAHDGLSLIIPLSGMQGDNAVLSISDKVNLISGSI